MNEFTKSELSLLTWLGPRDGRVSPFTTHPPFSGAPVPSVVGALLYAGHSALVFAACALACALASSPLMRLTA